MALSLASCALLIFLACGEVSSLNSELLGSDLRATFARFTPQLPSPSHDAQVPTVETIMNFIERGRGNKRARRQTAVLRGQQDIGYQSHTFEESLPNFPFRKSTLYNNPLKLGCFYFNMSSRIARHSRIHYAVLTFFKKCKKQKKRITQPSAFNIRVLKDGPKGQSYQRHGVPELQVDCRRMTGFHRIKVTELIMNWARRPGENHGLCVVGTDENTRNFLTAFSLQARNPRRGRGREATLSVIWENFANGAAPICRSGSGQQTCCRTSRWVDFAQLGLRGVVLFPLGYDAYACTGTCPGKNLTVGGNFVQALRANAHNCCHGTRYGSLSLVHFRENSPGLAMETYQNMSVLACGCN